MTEHNYPVFTASGLAHYQEPWDDSEDDYTSHEYIIKRSDPEDARVSVSVAHTAVGLYVETSAVCYSLSEAEAYLREHYTYIIENEEILGDAKRALAE